MKRRMFFLSLLVLMPLAAYAGETVSIGVSCTVPAVPGLNAPLVEKAPDTTAVQENAAAGVKTYYVR